MALQVPQDIKNSSASEGVVGSIPESGRCPEGGNDNPFQYSCQENPMKRGAWWNIVHRVEELDTTEHLSTHEDVSAAAHSCFLLLCYTI